MYLRDLLDAPRPPVLATAPSAAPTRDYLKRIFRADGGEPLAGCFDGSWADDVAVYNPLDQAWWVDEWHDGRIDSGHGPWSEPDDRRFVGDFDRSGQIDDIGVLRVSTNEYYFDYNADGHTNDSLRHSIPCSNSYPVAGDFDGGGYADDIALFSRITGYWYLDLDHDGLLDGTWGPWGLKGDIPLAGDFDSDGSMDDLAVFRPSSGSWYFDDNHDGTTNSSIRRWGVEGDKPFALDMDRDGHVDDIGVFRATTGMWYYAREHAGRTTEDIGPWGPTGPCWHLPSWTQPLSADGYPVGCGNTAWAMVYAYWHHFKGKTGLFGGLDLSTRSRASACESGSIYNIMFDIAYITETRWGGSGSDKYGLTYTWKMPQGIQYARDCGYSSANVVRWRGNEADKFDAIRGEIRNDRPVILNIDSDHGGSCDHYVGIEATTIQPLRGNKAAIGYLANWGWGEDGAVTLKWIYSLPVSYDPHHMMNDAYLVRF